MELRSATFQQALGLRVSLGVDGIVQFTFITGTVSCFWFHLHAWAMGHGSYTTKGVGQRSGHINTLFIPPDLQLNRLEYITRP
jgi:hypothetical protein